MSHGHYRELKRGRVPPFDARNTGMQDKGLIVSAGSQIWGEIAPIRDPDLVPQLLGQLSLTPQAGQVELPSS